MAMETMWNRLEGNRYQTVIPTPKHTMDEAFVECEICYKC